MRERILYWLPEWAPMSATTLGTSWLILAKSWVRRPTLEHERVHHAQAKRDGWRFLVRYLLFKSWRARYEAEAYAVNVRLGAIRIEEAARALSGPAYLWPVSRTKAEGLIRGFL